MKTKLTLSIDKNIVEAATHYGRRNKISVSRLVENHLKEVTSKRRIHTGKKTWAEKTAGILSGKITKKQLQADSRLKYLIDKISVDEGIH